METLTSFFSNCIDWKLVVLIVLTSIWVKKNFAEILPKITIAQKIFIWSTIITVLYYGINYLTGMFEIKAITCYLVTYLFSTSFYELFAKHIFDFITQNFGGNETPTGEK